MLSKIKSLTKESAVYGAGHILSRSIGFLLLPVHTNYIAPAEYGLAAVLFAYLVLALVFYTYGMDSAFLRYYILAEGIDEKKRIFSSAFWSVLFVSALFSGMSIALSDGLAVLVFEQARAGYFVQLCAGILFFDAIAVLPFLVLRAEKKSTQFAVLKTIAVAVNFILNIYFIILEGRGIEGIFLANLYSSAFSCVTVASTIFENLRLSFSRPDFRKLLAFGLPYIPADLAILMMNVIDRFILERLTDMATVGLYNFGYRLAAIMTLFVAAFRFAWHPFFLTTAKQENAKEIFAKILTYFVLACGTLFLFITLFVDDLIRLKVGTFSLFGTEYRQGVGVIPLLMLGQLLFGVYVNFLVGVYLREKTRYLPLITGLGAVSNIAGNFLLIPYLGMYGAAIATVVSYLLMVVSLYIVSNRLYPIPYELGRIAKLTAVVSICIVFGLAFSPGLWVKIIVFVIFPILLYWIGFFDRKEIAVLRAKLFPTKT